MSFNKKDITLNLRHGPSTLDIEPSTSKKDRLIET